MMFKEILSAFNHLKVYCFTNGFEMRFFWSFELLVKVYYCCSMRFWFWGEDSFGPILLDCSFKYSKTNFQCHNDNVCMNTFRYSKTTFSKIWTRYGEASYYGCFENKSENFTVHCTVHQLLFMVLFTPNFCLFKGGCPLSLGQNSFSRTSFF